MIILERLSPERSVIDEDGKQSIVPFSAVSEFREGDVLIRQGNGFIRDNAESELRKKKILDLQTSLFEEE